MRYDHLCYVYVFPKANPPATKLILTLPNVHCVIHNQFYMYFIHNPLCDPKTIPITWDPLTIYFYTSHLLLSDPKTIPLHCSSTPLTLRHLIPRQCPYTVVLHLSPSTIWFRDNPLRLKFYTSHPPPTHPKTIPLHCSSTPITFHHLIPRQSPYTKVLHHLIPRQFPNTVVLQHSPSAMWSRASPPPPCWNTWIPSSSS